MHWWQEGLTEYFRYTGIDRGHYYFGGGAQRRADSPDAIRTAIELITTPTTYGQLTPGDRGKFRYHSYRLMRFLMDNRKSWDDLTLRLGLYIDMVEDGADYQEAFEKAFDLTMDELAREMSEHGRNCCYRYKVPLETLEADFDPQVNELDRDTIKAALQAISASARDAANP
jgi:hypothetical protein